MRILQSMLVLRFFLFLFCALHSIPSVVSFVSTTRRYRSPSRASFTTSTRLFQWRSLVSRKKDSTEAIRELVDQVQKTIPTNDKNNDDNDKTKQKVAFLFVSEFHTYNFAKIVHHAYQGLEENFLLLSLIGGGVIGENQEYDESAPTISILWGTLPSDATATGFFDGPVKSRTALFRTSTTTTKIRQGQNSRIIFADPWFDLEESVLSQNDDREDAVVIGGVSCPSIFADEIRPTVGINGTALAQGSAAGITFSGSFGIQAIVAQGCRPIGPVFTITSAEGNILKELDGLPSLTQLEKVASGASIPDRVLMERNGLLCGIASKNSTANNAPLDFLIRQIMGLVDLAVDDKSGKGGGALSLGLKTLREGDQFQFQVRDGTAAQEDMLAMMKRAKVERLFAGQSAGSPVAAMQISCVARGRSLFGSANVDLDLIQRQLLGSGSTSEDDDERSFSDDTVPVGGFFANGEIGPIGISGFGSSSPSNTTHIHTFTTIVGLFCDYSKLHDSTRDVTPSEPTIEISSDDHWA